MAFRQLAQTLRPFGLTSGFQSLQVLGSRGFFAVAEGLHYQKSHEWVKIEGDIATVGISDHAQAELGDVVYVELPEVGKTFAVGDIFGVVESVKAASDVYSPIEGEVTEVNTVLSDSPATINGEPYTTGWLMKMKVSNKDVSHLMDSAAYEKETAH
eukprot:gene32007-5039_t